MWSIAETTTNQMGHKAPQETALFGTCGILLGNGVSLAGPVVIVLDPVVLRLGGCPCAVPHSNNRTATESEYGWIPH